MSAKSLLRSMTLMRVKIVSTSSLIVIRSSICSFGSAPRGCCRYGRTPGRVMWSQRLGHLVEVIDHLHVEVSRVDVAALAGAAACGITPVFAFARPGRRGRSTRCTISAQHLAVLLENGDQRAVVDARHLPPSSCRPRRCRSHDDLFGGLGRHGCGGLLRLGRGLPCSSCGCCGRACQPQSAVTIDATAIAVAASSISVSPDQKAIRNPPSAVMNHPDMTVITPVMRYTALSRPHARSASDEPIATMKQHVGGRQRKFVARWRWRSGSTRW